MLDLSTVDVDLTTYYANIEQGTDEWFRAKLGKASASHTRDITARTSNGQPAASRKNYMADLLLQRLTGTWDEGFSNRHMQRGIEMEPLAADAYAEYTGYDVQKIGWVPHPTIEMFGASPDRFVNSEGLCQIKAPDKAQHLAMYEERKIPIRYAEQMQSEMACTGRAWCDFVSFDDRFPKHMQLVIIRVVPDEERWPEIEADIIKFLAELDEKERKLRGMR